MSKFSSAAGAASWPPGCPDETAPRASTECTSPILSSTGLFVSTATSRPMSVTPKQPLPDSMQRRQRWRTPRLWPGFSYGRNRLPPVDRGPRGGRTPAPARRSSTFARGPGERRHRRRSAREHSSHVLGAQHCWPRRRRHTRDTARSASTAPGRLEARRHGRDHPRGTELDWGKQLQPLLSPRSSLRHRNTFRSSSRICATSPTATRSPR